MVITDKYVVVGGGVFVVVIAIPAVLAVAVVVVFAIPACCCCHRCFLFPFFGLGVGNFNPGQKSWDTLHFCCFQSTSPYSSQLNVDVDSCKVKPLFKRCFWGEGGS